jgi:anti-anti-sigma factor
LSDVAFLSEESLAVLIHALKLLRARGAALRLVRPSPFIQRKLQRTTLSAFFPIDED